MEKEVEKANFLLPESCRLPLWQIAMRFLQILRIELASQGLEMTVLLPEPGVTEETGSDVDDESSAAVSASWPNSHP